MERGGRVHDYNSKNEICIEISAKRLAKQESWYRLT